MGTQILRQLLIALASLLMAFTSLQASAQSEAPDTVTAGVYITSIHNIDFKEKEYSLNLWLWLKYKNRKFDFLQNLEVPQAKSVNRSFATVDSSQEKVYVLMKLQCVMKDEWATENFPFDKQKLRFAIENSQFDSKALVFVADTAGKQFDPKFTLRKWNIDSVKVSTGTKTYETAFGDPIATKPRSEYGTYKVVMQIERNAMGLFWKLFLGMYLSFLIAYMCFYIHTDNVDSRFSLSVGALFAVVGNKYIVDSSLPESSTFTLVDTLHGITLFAILIIMIANAHVLKLSKQDRKAEARKFDLVFGQVVVAMYLLINMFYIYRASRA